MEPRQRRSVYAWLFVAALLLLCSVLGALQYVWIGEVSVAERERLQQTLRRNLGQVREAFDREITDVCIALMPDTSPPDGQAIEQQYASRYTAWKAANRNAGLVRAAGVAIPQDGIVVLAKLNSQSGLYEKAEWPREWEALRARLTGRLTGLTGPFPGRGEAAEAYVLEAPRFPRPSGPPPGGPREPGRRQEQDWLIVELNPQYLREVLFPELLMRYLGNNDRLEYDVEVVTRTEPPQIVYATGVTRPIGERADAATGLFGMQFERIFQRGGPPPAMPGIGIRAGAMRPDSGRWELRVRHQAGSLNAVVERARRKNLAVTAGILLLMLATVAALVRYTRRSQHLAELEMNFVAGVSHELRTPLTVIRTAAYNLRGKLSNNPAQVERYGALIQGESERLTDLVEEVLRFARAKAGHVLQNTEPVAIGAIIEESLDSCKSVVEKAGCLVEQEVEPGLPVIQGDATALRHALQNLLTNAAKYGSEGGNWIGISARRRQGGGRDWIEIRVADRGPGIPRREQAQIFDPFYRGKRALQDQIHGTGLGLSIVHGIVGAHGGTIRVESEPMKGTEFVVEIPVPAVETHDEFTDSVSRG